MVYLRQLAKTGILLEGFALCLDFLHESIVLELVYVVVVVILFWLIVVSVVVVLTMHCIGVA